MSDSILHRWSKQKADSNSEDSTPAEELEANPIPAAESEPESTDESEKTVKKPEELPSIDSLGDDSDYSMFMSSEVDEGLKKLALRKLFKAPFFNVVDGLNDYDDDFTTFEALGDIVTSDMKFHEERKKAEEALKQQTDETQDVAEPTEVETLASDEPDFEPADSDENNLQSEELAKAEPDDTEDVQDSDAKDSIS